MNSNKNRAKNLLLLLLTSFIVIPLVGLGTYLFLYILPLEDIKNILPENNEKIQAQSLKIGILTNRENYDSLVDYLRKKFGSQVKITIDGNKNILYQEAKKQIATKGWDIAFTLSPMLSVAAKDNGYTFAARMFPNNPPYYQSVLFVRADSFIKSIEDLKPSTKIALGDFNSASSFYMPVYDLYGKTLNVNMGLRGRIIQEMVKNKQVDVGAASYGDTVKNDPDIRIIYQSRNIPSAGVYLSPNLSNSDRETIKKILNDAPIDIQQKSNFGKDKEPDYSYFQQIRRRTEEVLACSDFTKNPVKFFCDSRNYNFKANQNLNIRNTIIGRVNGWTRSNENTFLLNLSGESNQMYRVILKEEILNQVPNAGNVLSLQNKRIEVSDTDLKQLPNNLFELNVTQASQLKVLDP